MARPLNPDLPAEREQLRRLFLMKRTEGEMLSQRGYMLNQVAMMKVAQVGSRASQSFVMTDLTWLQNPTLGMVAGEPPTLSNDSPGFRAFLEQRAQTGLFQTRQEFSSIYYDLTGKPLIVLYLLNKPGRQVSMEEYAIVDTFIQLGAQQSTQEQPQMRLRDFILVTETGLNPSNTNKLRNRTIGYNIEVFLDIELAFPRIKHAYAPIAVEHIPRANVEQWSQREQLDASKLPMALNLDVVSKWFAAQPFDVIQTVLMGTTTDTIGYSRVVRQTPIKQ